MPTHIVISVDTEEEGLWGGHYQSSGHTTENLKGLARFQATCESMGVAPTYLIDAPVLDNHQAVVNLRSWSIGSRCEIGSHCHPWCNPPITEECSSTETSYVCNLPAEVQHQKLAWLTNRIGDTFGQRPSSYRAGRYGFDGTSAQVLNELGYRVDSSVLPLHDYRSQHGPDFRASNRFPHPLFDSPSQLVELPITSGFTGRGYNMQRRLWTELRKSPWARLRLAGIADRLGIARRVKLSPEGTRLSDLRRLVDRAVGDGLPVLVLMLHSSSLVAGFSPYAKDDAMLEKLYQRLTGIVRYAMEEHRAVPMTLTAAATSLFHDTPPKSTSTKP